MSSPYSSFMLITPVAQVPFSFYNHKMLQFYEETLTPLLLTDATALVGQWEKLLVNEGQLLCHLEELEGIFAECAAMGEDNDVEHPRYYGGELTLAKKDPKNLSVSSLFSLPELTLHRSTRMLPSESPASNSSRLFSTATHLPLFSPSQKQPGRDSWTFFANANMQKNGCEDNEDLKKPCNTLPRSVHGSVDGNSSHSEKQTETCSMTHAFFTHQSAANCGIDIMDSIVSQAQAFLSLKACALESRQRYLRERTDSPLKPRSSTSKKMQNCVFSVRSLDCSISSMRSPVFPIADVPFSDCVVAGAANQDVFSGHCHASSTKHRTRLPQLTLQQAWRVLAERRQLKVGPLLMRSPHRSQCSSGGGFPDAISEKEGHLSPLYRCFNLSTAAHSIDENSNTPLMKELTASPTALYVKTLLSECPLLLERLDLAALLSHGASVQNSASHAPNTRAPEPLSVLAEPGRNGDHHKTVAHAIQKSAPLPMQPVFSPLLLQPGTCVVFLMLAEKEAGTRTHVNVKGSHGWHILLKGRKKWRIVHPLDKHLMMNPHDGQVAPLFCDQLGFLYPGAQHARVYEFVQKAGEAVFIPADALHCEVALEDSIAFLVNFMDVSSEPMYPKYARALRIVEDSTRSVSLLAQLLPLTTVDIVLIDRNVFPRRGAAGQYPGLNMRQSVCVLRGLVAFSKLLLPCNELGARVELEALQSCFSMLGRTMVNCCSPPHYVVGVPKGYVALEADRRLMLYYYITPESLQHMRACFQKYSYVRRHLQWFECAEVSLSCIKLFSSTRSPLGPIPNYVPLSVLLGQAWPFEQGMGQRIVSVPHIILSKTRHSNGFVNPSTMWHCFCGDSRNAPLVVGQGRPLSALRAAAEAEAEAEEDARSGSTVSAFSSVALERADLSAPHPEAEQQSGGCLSRQAEREPDAHVAGEAMATPASIDPMVSPHTAFLATSLSSGFDASFKGDVTFSLTALQDDWCQTFLFYCSPLLDTPITSCLRAGAMMGKASTEPEGGDSGASVVARIQEFIWNPDQLEKYGTVFLLELSEHNFDTIGHRILTSPSFAMFADFLRAHGLHPPNASSKKTCLEGILAATLWFMCQSSVVGFSCTATDDFSDSVFSLSPLTRSMTGILPAAHPPPSEPPADAAADAVVSDNTCDLKEQGNLVIDGGAGSGNAEADESQEIRKWDTICFTASVASAFLDNAPDSSCAHIITNLCNWICDCAEKTATVPLDQLPHLGGRNSQGNAGEEDAAIFQTLRMVRKYQKKALRCGLPSLNEEKIAQLECLCAELRTATEEEGHLALTDDKSFFS